MKVSVKQDAPVDRLLINDIKEALRSAAPFTDNDSWDNLVVVTENPAELHSEASEPTTEKINLEPVAPELEPLDEKSPNAQGFVRQTQPRNAEASKLLIDSIKIPKPLTIEIARKETRLMADLLAEHPQIEVVRETLELGSFRVTDDAGNQLLIERKRCASEDVDDDFESSMKKGGQLFDMAARLKFEVDNSDHQVIPILILEGNLHTKASTLLIQQLDGAISYLAAVQRISVLTSLNANHSAYMIAKLAGHFIEGSYEPSVSRGPKPKTLFNQKIHVLESIPGVSTHIAETLLERFGSIKAIAAASQGELARVKGVGLKRAREISDVLGR
ncbi:ERCC4 domain-containing protein [Marinobacter sp. ELB17]|uniref:ERCC4 domain-containing protein n=1 Tax=Marinobacter sp. ELB17 TaxID=270374 RepID=UPI0018DDD44D|nr:ERCC4 domain-containing protein [Marinobacter sp. ELB17]